MRKKLRIKKSKDKQQKYIYAMESEMEIKQEGGKGEKQG